MVDKDKIIIVEEKPLEALQSEILTQVRDCTLAWAQGTGPVKKCDICPTEMPECLPHISLVERLNSGSKIFKIRLVGEEIVNRTLGYMAGHFIEDLTPDFYSQALIKYYNLAIDHGHQVAQDITWDYDHRLLRIERFMVPLFLDEKDTSPTGLLIATVRGDETQDYMQKERHFKPENA